MSKNYDLYPKYERKVDNWRRRILGYEKMKRDLQKQIQILKSKNKKQKEVIDKAIAFYENNKQECVIGRTVEGKLRKDYYLPAHLSKTLIDILKEVSE
jgi:hypothetical protein